MRKKLSEIYLSWLPFDHWRPTDCFGPEGGFDMFW